ncbi:MAG TPA: hypothetical protein VMS60_00410 [Solirubrobacterales bacterium]|nr:hypothetical protein [Solirubrobacterales bacterium]
MAAVTGINFAIFAALGSAYLDWYLQSGFIVALVFAVVAIAVDLDLELHLIAAHPFIFVRGVFSLLAQVIAAAVQPLEEPRADSSLAEAGDGYESLQSRFRPPTLDRIFATVFSLIFAAAMLAWALVVAPLQYWVNLLCGAPARTALASPETLWRVKQDGQRTKLVYGSKDEKEFREEELDAREGVEVSEIPSSRSPSP